MQNVDWVGRSVMTKYPRVLFHKFCCPRIMCLLLRYSYILCLQLIVNADNLKLLFTLTFSIKLNDYIEGKCPECLLSILMAGQNAHEGISTWVPVFPPNFFIVTCCSECVFMAHELPATVTCCITSNSFLFLSFLG